MLGSKRVLVTGIAGLIGKELITPLVDAGYEVYAIIRNSNYANDNVNLFYGDIFDNYFLKQVMQEIKPQYLINLAWITTGDYLSSDKNYNYLSAGINLLTNFYQNGGKRLINAGTCFEYKFKNEPLCENGELDSDKYTYTYCKNKLNEISHFFCNLNNISYAYARIFYAYGRNEKVTRFVGMIIDKLSKSESVIIKNGSLYKDYIYSKDIACALTKLLDSDIQGNINICSGKKVAIKDFALAIGNKMKKKNLVLIEEHEESNQPQVILGDNTRLINDLGYEYMYDINTSLDEILEYTEIN